MTVLFLDILIAIGIVVAIFLAVVIVIISYFTKRRKNKLRAAKRAESIKLKASQDKFEVPQLTLREVNIQNYDDNLKTPDVTSYSSAVSVFYLLLNARIFFYFCQKFYFT